MNTKFLWSACAIGIALISPVPLTHAQSAPELDSFEAVKIRKRAETFEKQGKYAACAESYMELYRGAPKAGQGDLVLYNAGVCYEGAKSAGLAIRVYSLLDQRFPSSRLASKALLRRAYLAASQVDYEGAAEAFELYARRFGGEREAPSALQNAFTYRRALGQSKKAIANLERYAKTYGRKRKEGTASALFAIAEMHEAAGNGRAAITAYKHYIARIGKKGGRERLLIAHAKAGALLWKASCSRPLAEDGSCSYSRSLQKKRKASSSKVLPRRCRSSEIVDTYIVARDKGKVEEAQRFFSKAIRMASRVGERGESAQRIEAEGWLAASKFYLLEAGFESYLAIKFPRGLQFSPKNMKARIRSEKAFSEWLVNTKKEARELNAGYGDLKNSLSAGAWAIASVARSGQVAHHFAQQLQGAEIPKEVRTGPYASKGVDAYCGTLTSAAVPMVDLAVTAFSFCIELSTKLEQPGKWSRLCEQKLVELVPADFPLATEKHGAAAAVGDIVDTEALMSDATEPKNQRR